MLTRADSKQRQELRIHLSIKEDSSVWVKTAAADMLTWNVPACRSQTREGSKGGRTKAARSPLCCGRVVIRVGWRLLHRRLLAAAPA